MSVRQRAIAVSVIAAISGAIVWLAWNLGDEAQEAPYPEATPDVAIQDKASAVELFGAPSRPVNIEPLQNVPAAASAAPVPGSELDMPTLASCHAAEVVKQITENRTRCANVPVDDLNSQDYCRKQQTAMAQELQQATAASASCPQVLANAPAYFDAVKARALRGDIAAQRCFIQGYFQNWSEEGGGDPLRPEQLAEYPGLARKFIDDSFVRGDWSVVRWLGRITLRGTDGLLQKAYPTANRNIEVTYRMKYLLMLGRQQDTQGDDPRRIVEAWQEDELVTTEQAANGQRWAQEMFEKHFSVSQEGANISDVEFCKSE